MGRRKSRCIGYIVEGAVGAKQLEVDSETGALALWNGSGVTLFPSYNAARNAVRRTLTLARRLNYRNEVWQQHRITPVYSA